MMNPYRIIEGHDYQFPLIGYQKRSLTREGIATLTNVYGTAFYLGDNCFLTAGHALTAASENDIIGIGFIAHDRYICAEALQHEVLTGMDLGILRTVAIVERAKALPWEPARIPALATVMASGYPFGLDPEERHIATRSFKGHIVSRRPFAMLAAKPWVYELSFASPTGLSGAPLIALEGDLRVVGLVIGNYETKIQVFSDEEIISSEHGAVIERTVVERYHTMQLGIAIESTALLHIASEILNSNLDTHLRKNGFLK